MGAVANSSAIKDGSEKDNFGGAVKPKEALESIAELKAVINKDLDHKYLKNLNAERRCVLFSTEYVTLGLLEPAVDTDHQSC